MLSHSLNVVDRILAEKEIDVDVTDDEEEEEEEGEAKEEASTEAKEDDGTAGSEPKDEASDDRKKPIDPFLHVKDRSGWLPFVRCRYVFNKILEDENSDAFIDPVDLEEYPEYTDTVEMPMDLFTIRKELEKEEPYGGNPQFFLKNMLLIWSNAQNFNDVASQLWQAADLFTAMTKRLYKAWVANFEHAGLDFDNPLARPFESGCRKCHQTSEDEHILVCDFCDAEYHPFCLDTPLPGDSDPPFLWQCPTCYKLKIYPTEDTSHSYELEVKRKIANTQKLRHTEKQKRYLVKWKDMSYTECTWESAEDLQDNVKIEEFRSLITTRPKDTISEGEMKKQLCNAKVGPKPSMRTPDEQVERLYQIHGQAQALGFAWQQVAAPACVLKRCGPMVAAYVDTAMKNENKAKGGEAEAKQGPTKGESSAAAPKSEPLSLVRAECALVLERLVDHVASGTCLNPYKDKPLRRGEYVVSFYRKEGESLWINLTQHKDNLAMADFRRGPNGEMGALELSGRVHNGDMLVMINNVNTTRFSCGVVVKMLQQLVGFITLRFVKTEERKNILSLEKKAEEAELKLLKEKEVKPADAMEKENPADADKKYADSASHDGMDVEEQPVIIEFGEEAKFIVSDVEQRRFDPSSFQGLCRAVKKTENGWQTEIFAKGEIMNLGNSATCKEALSKFVRAVEEHYGRGATFKFVPPDLDAAVQYLESSAGLETEEEEDFDDSDVLDDDTLPKEAHNFGGKEWCDLGQYRR